MFIVLVGPGTESSPIFPFRTFFKPLGQTIPFFFTPFYAGPGVSIPWSYACVGQHSTQLNPTIYLTTPVDETVQPPYLFFGEFEGSST